MNQTEHYGLSQWALTDRVEMKDFNADNAKLDAALAALAGTQTGESARLDAAIAAAKAELAGTQTSESARLDKAMAAETKRVNAELAKKALASDLATAKTALETSVSGLSTSKLEQVTLLNSSFTLSGKSCSITVPGKEMAKCSVVLALITSTSSSTDTVFSTASDTYCHYHTMGVYNSTSGLFRLYSGRPHILVFFPIKGVCPYVSGISIAHDNFHFFYGSVSYSSFTSILGKPYYSDGTLSGSGTIKIYGLR